MIPICCNFFQKTEAKGLLPNSFCEASIAPIPKRDKGITSKGKLQANLSHKYRCKSPQNYSNPTMYEKNYTLQTSGICSRFKYNAGSTFKKSVNVIYHINRLKKKNHRIISAGTEKSFDKVQHSFMIKSSQQTRNRGEFYI